MLTAFTHIPGLTQAAGAPSSSIYLLETQFNSMPTEPSNSFQAILVSKRMRLVCDLGCDGSQGLGVHGSRSQSKKKNNLSSIVNSTCTQNVLTIGYPYPHRLAQRQRQIHNLGGKLLSQELRLSAGFRAKHRIQVKGMLSPKQLERELARNSIGAFSLFCSCAAIRRSSAGARKVRLRAKIRAGSGPCLAV
ncbi:hypothetical protein MPTK1_4g16710 [Marchantia polymorpha subsp. ruderalis]|uniref:Uncharacterized protein n=2 Tax=Marchantia polymorpha TaxID=3197 RepID=A0AAF6BAL3_MARPO|nr:hypothetical protein MARPO_0054s0138 [Marchantia polymorpha]BBN09047.1 hypothetical protein Mp_4g16710 [Marchantia polymorpha subsp. ruderalis]|eukprot:PTQ38038.1 hypothetical protein MARPO_0054s0138 [Marchantia polymorpha]